MILMIYIIVCSYTLVYTLLTVHTGVLVLAGAVSNDEPPGTAGEAAVAEAGTGRESARRLAPSKRPCAGGGTGWSQRAQGQRGAV